MPFKLRSLALALAMFAVPAASLAQIGISITIAPPELQDYEQPEIPGDGYIWTPGYWAYGDEGYYWVSGAWVMPPEVGVLWTPGYWDWNDGAYAWNRGYWGRHVGFYGGVNYGHGYGGRGYEGGRWNNGRFDNNRAVNNVNVTNVHNTYNETVVNNGGGNRVSFNGGSRGTHAAPSAEERSTAHEHHVAATTGQSQHEQGARGNPGQRESADHGRLPVAAGNAAETRNPAPAQRPVPERPAQDAIRMDHSHDAGATREHQQARPQPEQRAQQQPLPQQEPRQQQQPRPQQEPRPQQQARPQQEQRQQQQPRPQQEQHAQQQARPQQEQRQQQQPRPQQEQQRPQQQARPQQEQQRPQQQARPQQDPHERQGPGR